MSTRRAVAFALALSMAIGTAPALVTVAAQTAGAIGGRANDEAKKPYTDYSVLLRDVVSGQVVSTVPLDTQGLFLFKNVDLSRRFLVELFNIKANRVVCTEGPYTLSDKLMAKTDVNISCGNNAAWWLLAAGAGAAAAIALATQSTSK
jgi:hypothetical protein